MYQKLSKKSNLCQDIKKAPTSRGLKIKVTF